MTLNREVRAGSVAFGNHLPLALIDCAEGVLIGVQRNFRVNDKGLPAGDANDDVGAEASALPVVGRNLRLKISLFGQTAAFEYVAQLLLAPTPARFGGIAECVDELCGFGRHTFGPGAH